jgi:hypothetical protein
VANDDWIPGNPNDRSIAGFRLRHGGRKAAMSKSKYYSMRKAGIGPVEQIIGRMRRITPEAEREWDERMMAAAAASGDTATRLARRELKRARKTKVGKKPRR